MKIVVFGALGRMGKEIVDLLLIDNEVISVGVKKADNVMALDELNVSDADVAIDFSAPEALEGITSWCKSTRTPLVCGTTGLEEQEFSLFAEVAQDIPVLWAPNMSVGVALLNKLVKELGTLSKDFDFQIEEFHHRHKKDSPSGTGAYLQKTLEKTVDKDVPDVLSIRGGGIFGVHKVWSMSEEETICLEHTALNRTVFAKGAIRAAFWIIDQKAGFYNMEDVLEK